jgi:hypothetical protein
VASRLSDNLDPALRLVDVEHVRGTGQRDQPRLGQQAHDEPNGPRKRRVAEVALDDSPRARNRISLAISALQEDQ